MYGWIWLDSFNIVLNSASFKNETSTLYNSRILYTIDFHGTEKPGQLS
jgi:hypothetical protein